MTQMALTEVESNYDGAEIAREVVSTHDPEIGKMTLLDEVRSALRKQGIEEGNPAWGGAMLEATEFVVKVFSDADGEGEYNGEPIAKEFVTRSILDEPSMSVGEWQVLEGVNEMLRQDGVAIEDPTWDDAMLGAMEFVKTEFEEFAENERERINEMERGRTARV